MQNSPYVLVWRVRTVLEKTPLSPNNGRYTSRFGHRGRFSDIEVEISIHGARHDLGWFKLSINIYGKSILVQVEINDTNRAFT